MPVKLPTISRCPVSDVETGDPRIALADAYSDFLSTLNRAVHTRSEPGDQVTDSAPSLVHHASRVTGAPWAGLSTTTRLSNTLLAVSLS